MDKPSQNVTTKKDAEPRMGSDDPGAQAAEALAWAIAQEFVLAFDEFNNSVLEDEQSARLKSKTATH